MCCTIAAAAVATSSATAHTKLLVVENTATVHNLVVCTLCSCFPLTIVGRPPDWYKSRSYRSRSVREPRKVLAEFGLPIAPEVEVRVHDSTADCRYLVLPARPPGTEGLSEEQLKTLVTRDSMVGVALAQATPSAL
jgi:nitrile hydratase